MHTHTQSLSVSHTHTFTFTLHSNFHKTNQNNNNKRSSPRVAYMFEKIVLQRVSVLDGGLPAWKAQKLPLHSRKDPFCSAVNHKDIHPIKESYSDSKALVYKALHENETGIMCVCVCMAVASVLLCVYACVCVCAYVCVRVCMSLRVCVYIYVCVYVCVSVCVSCMWWCVCIVCVYTLITIIIITLITIIIITIIIINNTTVRHGKSKLPDEMKQFYKDSKTLPYQILDARPAGRFDGTVPGMMLTALGCKAGWIFFPMMCIFDSTHLSSNA